MINRSSTLIVRVVLWSSKPLLLGSTGETYPDYGIVPQSLF